MGGDDDATDQLRFALRTDANNATSDDFYTATTNGSNFLGYDVTIPTISGITNSTTSSNYGTGGHTVVIAGTGFNASEQGDNDIEELTLGSTVLAVDANITQNSDTQITAVTKNDVPGLYAKPLEDNVTANADA